MHVPADKHKGPDVLSRWALAKGEIAEPDDDSWLDNITLLTHFAALHNDPFTATSCESTYNPTTFSWCFSAWITQENMLSQIHHFLDTLETPTFKIMQKKWRFMAKSQEFLVKIIACTNKMKIDHLWLWYTFPNKNYQFWSKHMKEPDTGESML